MKVFRERLEELNAPFDQDSDRLWVVVPYDQLSDRIGPLSVHKPRDMGIVLVESTDKGRRRPYHKQKLALLLANQRHFALEQARRGVAVDYRFTDKDYGSIWAKVARRRGGLLVQEPAERELRQSVAIGQQEGWLEIVRHEGWLTSAEEFSDSQQKGPPYRMDRFYQAVRRRTGILMEEGRPVGGRYSFDGDNREFWPGEPEAAALPRFEPDEITREVIELVERDFADHPGHIDKGALPATSEDAEALWTWAKRSCMEHFGAYEDAMSRHSRTLFHTRISGLLNLHRLLPSEVVADVEAMEIPLNSKEGFIRQVLGWREFVRHIHRATDGFRDLPDGYEAWARSDDERGQSYLGADNPLPPAYWGETSGLRCLDEVVSSVLQEGYSHHITRLMVLSNIAVLLDSDPEALNRWFWTMYVDAYDWVVEPNVLAMGAYAVGDLMTTKPYVSGSNYINKMSDYCGGCAFDPGSDCPLRFLYWAFLERHREGLKDNRRMGLMLGQLKRRSDAKKAKDEAVFDWVGGRLKDGEAICPQDLEALDESI